MQTVILSLPKNVPQSFPSWMHTVITSAVEWLSSRVMSGAIVSPERSRMANTEKALNLNLKPVLMKHLLFLFCSTIITINAAAQSQYASSVIAFSSEWSPTSWSAQQALGAPNTTGCGDIATAWASASADGAREWLVLGFATPQPVGVINIWETWNPGAVDTIYLRNSSTGVWNNVYTATAAPALPCPRTFTITIPTTGYNVDAIRLAINSPAVTSWNEIDAVEIQLNCSTGISTINNPLFCFGMCNASATATGSGPGPFTYSWTTTPSQTTQTATGLCAGTYTVTVTDANMCTSTTAVTITEPSQVTLSVSNSPTLCFGDCSGTLTATPGGGTPGYTYNWTPGNWNTATVTGLCAGTYTVTVTDQNGCSASTTATITSYPAIVPNSQVTNPILCNGNCNGAATCNPTGGCGAPYTYLWIPGGQTTQSISNLCAGNYTVTITDPCGCTASQTITLTQPPALTVSATATPETCPGCCDGTANGNATGGTGPYSYIWTPPLSTLQNISGLCPAIYTLCVTDANGCTTCDTAVVNPSTVGMEDQIDQSVQISPNPFSSYFTISFGPSVEGECRIELFDVTGKLVYQEMHFVKPGTVLEIAPDVPLGVYLLEIKLGNEKIGQRLLKY